MNNLKYIQLSKPKGRAYADNEISGHRENVKALSIQRTIDKFQLYNDSLYPINGNFPLTTWEDRFNITPLSGQTIAERTAEVKKKMDFPKGQMNRLSLSYIQSQLDYYGFDKIKVRYNDEEDVAGYIHGNNITTTERYSVNLNKYNSFIIIGELNSIESYSGMIRLVMSLKPVDCFIVDKVSYKTVLAVNSNTIFAINGTQALLLNFNDNYIEEDYYSAVDFKLDSGLL